MRIDARLVAVKDGEVVVSATAEGERDAFFELEKSLVRKLAAGLSPKLPPKVRGAMARFHTTDFKAFQRFSLGLQRADENRLAEARAAMREAAQIDDQFDLAKRSLAELDKLVEAVGVQREKAVDLGTLLLKTKGDDRATKLHRFLGKLRMRARKRSGADRLVAQYILASALLTQPRGMDALWSRIDRFAAEREGETWLRLLWSGALKSSGTPLVPRNRIQIERGGRRLELLPLRPEHPVVDLRPSDFSYLRKQFWREPLMDSAGAWERRLFSYAQDLEADPAAGIRTAEALVTVAKKWMSEVKYDDATRYRFARRVNLALADAYLGAQQLSDATRVLTAAARGSEDAVLLKKVEERLAFIRDLTAFSRGTAKHQALATEWVFSQDLDLRRSGTLQRRMKEALTYFGEALEPIGRHRLAQARGWPECCAPRRIAGEPVWVIQGNKRISAGQRPSGRTLQYYGHKEDDPVTTPVLAVTGRSLSDGVVQATITYAAPKDWWPRQVWVSSRHVPTLVDGRATAGVLVGLQDVWTGAAPDRAKTPPPTPERPMHGLLARVSGANLELVAIKTTQRDRPGSEPWRATKIAFEERVLDSAKMATEPDDGLVLTVTTKGGTVRASAGGVTVDSKVPEAWSTAGFSGVWLSGRGYAEITTILSK